MRNRILLLLFAILAVSVASSAQAKMPKPNWADFEGTKVRYYDIGNPKATEALVFVHCWTCNVEFWKDNYTAFPDLRVIAMDLPGHGQSDKPKVEYTMEYFARSVDAVMKTAGVRRAVLAGHSMGTPITRRYYELYPDKTVGLIIVDGALLPIAPRDQVDKFFEPLFKDYKTGVPTFVDGMLPPTIPADIRAFVRASMLSTPEHVGRSAMKNMLDDSYRPHDKIHVPVLAVMAYTDFWPKDIQMRYSEATGLNLDFHMWNGVSHFLQMERPVDFNKTVRKFLVAKSLLGAR